MSDKLQFVVPCGTGYYRSIDKLKFIGHPIQSCIAAPLATALYIAPDGQSEISDKELLAL